MWYQHVLIGIYLAILLCLAVYGFHRTKLVWLFYRYKHRRPEPKGLFSEEDLPRVTVQLPLFNEMYVAEAEHFIDCIASNRKPAVSARDGKAVLELVLAAKKSSDAKKVISL